MSSSSSSSSGKHQRQPDDDDNFLSPPAKKQKWAEAVTETTTKLQEAQVEHNKADNHAQHMYLLGSLKQQNRANKIERLAYLSLTDAGHRCERARSLPHFWDTVSKHIRGVLPVPENDGLCFLHPGTQECTDSCDDDTFCYECPGCMGPSAFKDDHRHVMLTVFATGKVQYLLVGRKHPRFNTLCAGQLSYNKDGLKTLILTFPCRDCANDIQAAVALNNGGIDQMLSVLSSLLPVPLKRFKQPCKLVLEYL